MNKTKILTLVTIFFLLMVVLACQVDFSNVDENEVSMAVAQTMDAKAAEAEQAQALAEAQLQAQQAQPEPAPTQAPDNCCCYPYDWRYYNYWYGYEYYWECNDARFIYETVPDYSVFYPGETFTKTWRIENTGSCTWTTDYRLALQSGDSMGAYYDQYFVSDVRPGESTDITLNLRAPSRCGRYTTFWKLEDSYGRKFGQLYLIIDVR